MPILSESEKAALKERKAEEIVQVVEVASDEVV
jgi:hypothetical protein